MVARLREAQEGYRASAKKEIAAAPERKSKKKDAPQVKTKKEVEAAWNKKINWFDEVIETATQANWLYEKFGEGVYADVPGLCKIANRNEIAEKKLLAYPRRVCWRNAGRRRRRGFCRADERDTCRTAEFAKRKRCVDG